jgi:hypothetical protein
VAVSVGLAVAASRPAVALATDTAVGFGSLGCDDDAVGVATMIHGVWVG